MSEHAKFHAIIRDGEYSWMDFDAWASPDEIKHGKQPVHYTVPTKYARLIEAAPEMRAMLKGEEWGAMEMHGPDWTPACPTCRNPKPQGHTAECARAALLAKVEDKR